MDDVFSKSPYFQHQRSFDIMERLGFIGTGGMGGPMAANLLKAGFKLTVYDVRREASRLLEEKGAAYAPSPRAVAEASEVVLSMLPFGEAVREVGLGKSGLVEAASGARIWIDLSSVEQQAIIEVEKSLRAKGWTVIDASVGGVEEYAAAGELSIKVAGDKAAVDRIRPLLEPMGKKTTYCGVLGNAKLVKTAIAMHAAVRRPWRPWKSSTGSSLAGSAGRSHRRFLRIPGPGLSPSSVIARAS